MVGPLREIVKGQQQAIMQLGELFAGMMQQMAQQQAEALRIATAPRELVRDPRTGAKRVQVVLQ